MCIENLSIAPNLKYYGADFRLEAHHWSSLASDSLEIKKFVHFTSFFDLSYALHSENYNVKHLCLSPEILHDFQPIKFSRVVRNVPALNVIIKYLPNHLQDLARHYISEWEFMTRRFQNAHKYLCGTSYERYHINAADYRANAITAEDIASVKDYLKACLPIHCKNPPKVLSSSLRDTNFPFFYYLDDTKTLASRHYKDLIRKEDVAPLSLMDWAKTFRDDLL